MAELGAAAAVGSERDASIAELEPADAADLLLLVGERRFTPAGLARELADRHRYRWVGIRQPDGLLAAAHRALSWGDYLFLKGVFVDPTARGSDFSLRLAIELRRIARQEDRRGIAAWISQSSQAQVVLARRLRLAEVGPTLHLYALPFPPPASALLDPMPDPIARADEILLSYQNAAAERALVPDLLSQPAARRCLGSAAIRSLPDRDHLLLSGLPCASPDEVTALLGDLATVAQRLSLSAMELPAPASEILLSLWLAGRKAQRLSWRPVRLGRSDFEQPKEIRP